MGIVIASFSLIKAAKMKLFVLASCLLFVRGAPVKEDDDLKDILNRPISNMQIINNNLQLNVNVAVGNTQHLPAKSELLKELSPKRLKLLEPMVLDDDLQYGATEDIIEK